MKTVLVTGCSSGYGLEIARLFHERGWKVVATMRTPREAVLPQSDRMLVLALDVTRPESIAAALEASGHIDVLVNNAGIGLFGATEPRVAFMAPPSAVEAPAPAKLFVMPEATLKLFGWTTVDPVATRMVAAALAGIGVESFVMRNGSVDAFRTMLGLKCVWSGVAVAGLSISIARGAAPTTWALLLIFVAFGTIWNSYCRRLRPPPARAAYGNDTFARA